MILYWMMGATMPATMPIGEYKLMSVGYNETSSTLIGTTDGTNFYPSTGYPEATGTAYPASSFPAPATQLSQLLAIISNLQRQIGELEARLIRLEGPKYLKNISIPGIPGAPDAPEPTKEKLKKKKLGNREIEF